MDDARDARLRPTPLDAAHYLASPRASGASSSSAEPSPTASSHLNRVDSWDLLHCEEGEASPHRDIENAIVNPLSWLHVDRVGPKVETVNKPQKRRTIVESLDQKFASWVTSQLVSPSSSSEAEHSGPTSPFGFVLPRRQPNLSNVV